MTAWLEFALAFIVFLASHRLPTRPAARARLVDALGERAYLAAYMTVSLVLLAWLISAAGRAPYVPLWDFAPWQLWAPTIAMPLACLAAAFGAGAPNPFSILGRADGFDPDRPGIAGVTRHPILWAFALWSGAHLVPNGDLAHAVLFGAFLAFALVGGVALDRRRQRQMGPDVWARDARRTSFVPFAALVAGRWRPSPSSPDLPRLAIAAALWLVLLLLHPPLIGVSALPG